MCESGLGSPHVYPRYESTEELLQPSSRTHLHLAHFGGHARHIVPPLSPSQPVIADEKISCWGKEPSRSSFIFLFFLTSFSSAHTTQAQTKLRKSQCLQQAQENNSLQIGPAQSSRVHTVVRSCRPKSDNASKQA